MPYSIEILFCTTKKVAIRNAKARRCFSRNRRATQLVVLLQCAHSESNSQYKVFAERRSAHMGYRQQYLDVIKQIENRISDEENERHTALEHHQLVEQDFIHSEQLYINTKRAYIWLRSIALLISIAILIIGPIYMVRAYFTTNTTEYETYIDNSDVVKQISTYVCYTTNSGRKYHAAGCQYLWNSSHETTVYEAEERGYSACSKCTPTERTTINITETNAEEKQRAVEITTKNYVMPVLICLIIAIVLYNLVVFKKRGQYGKILAEKNNNELSYNRSLSDLTSITNAIENDKRELDAKKSKLSVWDAECQLFLDQIKGNSIYDIANISDNLVFNRDYYPVGTKDNPTAYTVYCTSIPDRNKRYHHKRGCSTAYYNISIVQARERGMVCCSKCIAHSFPVPDSIYQVHKILRALKEKYSKFDLPFNL